MLGTGSKWKDNEIRYSLRSVEKFLTGYDRIFVIGQRPSFLQNVIHVPCEDVGGRKQYSIYRKILKAVNDDRVSSDFIFINDDHFILKPLDVSEFSYWYQGRLEDKWRQYNGSYKKAAGNNLEATGNVRYTDIHTPIVYNKEHFKNLEPFFKTGNEYIIKTLYTSFFDHLDFLFTPMEDLKIGLKHSLPQLKSMVDGRMFFSLGPYAVYHEIKVLLQDLYPTKSKYEK